MPNLNRATLLIVDDEKLMREAIAVDFKRNQFNVLLASNGQEAFELVKSSKVDVVLSDLRMPNGDGLELLKNVRQFNPFIPVVMFITGYVDVSAEQAYDQGVDAILAKPFNRKMLMDIVRRSLEPSEKKWRSPRAEGLKIPIEISAKNLNAAIDAKVLNIGRGGMFVAADISQIPPLESKIYFNINFTPGGSKPSRGYGVVRWTRLQNESGMPAGFGVEFLFLEDDLREQILKIIQLSQTKAFIPKL